MVIAQPRPTPRELVEQGISEMKQLATSIVELTVIVMVLITVAVSTAALSQWGEPDQASDGVASPKPSAALMAGGH
jgi:cytochrome c-type biogenesis protein CcmH/NrfG